jgi:ESCRT-II complex subunit VPS25
MSTSDQQSSSNSFVFPEFWSYPPYFTLQPIPETQQKQKELWRSLILSYCRHHRLFQINVDDAAAQQTPPFANPAIKRTLIFSEIPQNFSVIPSYRIYLNLYHRFYSCRSFKS